ncbi:MAG TPA: hypothetical protein EYO58_08000 [Flavobacteriales bacterium]|nr:hypothetical protein [Flavobacteriales bacterium]
MRKIPTDLKILNTIYYQYYETFTNFSARGVERSNKIHVPIEISLISKKLKVDDDIIFGRLYYHMNKKYGHQEAENSYINIFCMRVGADRHCIQFPLMASVLSELQSENSRFRWATTIASTSLVISLISLLIGILR